MNDVMKEMTEFLKDVSKRNSMTLARIILLAQLLIEKGILNEDEVAECLSDEAVQAILEEARKCS